jgi:hypothetical protein
MFASQVPVFVSIAFAVAICFPVVMIANLVRETTQKSKRNGIIGFYIGYLTVVSILCFMGIFDVVALPPRIVVITIIPLLLFYLLFISNTRFYRSFFQEVQLRSLVSVHIFRLIGSFFLILFFLDQLPKTFASIAGLGDLITAVSSLFVAKAIQQKKSFARSLTLLWNSFGLVDILITSATAVILTKQNIETGSMGVDVLTQFPFCFIPAFAPATIIFLHITIYRKVFSEKKR